MAIDYSVEIHKFSTLSPVPGRTYIWQAPNGQEVQLPVKLELIWENAQTHQLIFKSTATIGFVQNEPVILELTTSSPFGLDLKALQNHFRWRSPLDVITILVPKLMEKGIDPYSYKYPVEGFPDCVDIMDSQSKTNRLSDQFLEELAVEYLKSGRGYASQIAKIRGVSERTVVSWVEKARDRNILTRVNRGQTGGKIIPPEER